MIAEAHPALSLADDSPPPDVAVQLRNARARIDDLRDEIAFLERDNDRLDGELDRLRVLAGDVRAILDDLTFAEAMGWDDRARDALQELRWAVGS